MAAAPGSNAMVVLEPSIFGRAWDIKPVNIDVTKVTQNEIARNLSKQIEQRIQETERLTVELEFKNIKVIDNLWGFNRLVELRLDNNCIEKIEKLGHLVTLTSLDLSFNHIAVIEGLDTLTNLEELNLSNNRITKLGGLDALRKLEMLMLGHNRIGEVPEGAEPDPKKQLDELRYLRQFRGLEMLSIEHNPVASSHDCDKLIIAYCDALVYLNFRIIDVSARKAAAERFNDDLIVIREDEAAATTAEAEAEKEAAALRLLGAAHLLGFETLHEEMLDDGPEPAKWRLLPGVDVTLDKYSEGFTALKDAFVAAMFAVHQQRTELVRTFGAEIDAEKAAVEEEARADIQAFETWRRRELYPYMATLVDRRDYDQFDAQIAGKLVPAIQALSDKLMEAEVFVVEQFEDASIKFERAITDLVSNHQSDVVTFMIAVRDLEIAFAQSLAQLAEAAQVQIAKDEAGPAASASGAPDALAQLLKDSEGLANLLAAAHDLRMDRINACEDDYNLNVVQENEALFSKIRTDLRQRNRDRVEEIYQLALQYESEKDEVSRSGMTLSMLV